MFRRVLARFGFSFMALAFVLGYQGYMVSKVEGQTSRATMFYLGAAACAAAGFAGLRERHRPPV